MTATQSIEVFYSYSHKDERLLAKLIEHLAVLKRQGIITDWYDRDIAEGSEWKDVIEEHLNSASIILLLVSSSFMASDYCFGVELGRAMERHEKGEARVIPVILSPCLWEDAPFGKLQALPKDAKPVTEWANRNRAFLSVTRGIQAAVTELVARQQDPETEPQSKFQDTHNANNQPEESTVAGNLSLTASGHQAVADSQNRLNEPARYVSPALATLLGAREYSDTATNRLLIADQDLRASLPNGVPFLFKDKELGGTIIRNVTAHNIRFRHCNLEQLKLYGSRFRRVDFEDSALAWLVVFKSELDRVHINNCDLTGALFARAILSRKTVISDCTMDGVVFYASTFLGRTEERVMREWPEATFHDCQFDSKS